MSRQNRMMQGTNKYLTIGILAFLLLIVAVVVGPISMGAISSIGFTQGTQGMNWEFDSVYWQDSWWSRTEHGTAPLIYAARTGLYSRTPSALEFGHTLNLNPDDPNKGFPTLAGTFGTFYAYANNSRNDVYTWQIPVGKNPSTQETIYRQYQMQRVYCTMSVNVYLAGTGDEAGVDGNVPNYGGAQIWIKMTPNNFAYFRDNPQAVYFAPEYIGLTKDVEIATKGGGGNINKASSLVADAQSLNPQAKGDSFGIYYQRGGDPISFTGGSSSLLSYQGQMLDPQIFRNEYWTKISLNTFMAANVWSPFWYAHDWAFPSTHFELEVYMFVIGQWTVNVKPGETATQNIHPMVMGSVDPVANIFAFASNPWVLLIILAVVFIIAVIVMAIFFPSAIGLINKGVGAASSGATKASRRLKKAIPKKRKRRAKKGS